MKQIKGVVLAGGKGLRLYPLTKVTNKHLLPVYNKPMIYYPLEKLAQAGIKEAIIVTGGQSAGEFLRLLGDGKEFGFRTLQYVYQESESGIAHALSLTEHFANKMPVVVILGDNVFEDDISDAIERFLKQKKGARIFLKDVPDPQRFGVPVFDKKGKIVAIEEKPRVPKSKYAVTGIYMYDNKVYDFIRRLKPSDRGELEITEINNFYIEAGEMEYEILKGWWTDAGTFDSLLRASTYVKHHMQQT
jgi:glucose-1-phosphate thymidylyltransferase